LFRELYLDFWRQANSNSRLERVRLERSIERLKDKKVELIDRSLDGQLKNEIFEIQLDRLSNNLEKTEKQLQTQKIVGPPSPEFLDFLEKLLLHIDTIWCEADYDIKLLVQEGIFPEGLTFDGRECGTTNTSCIFNKLGGLNAPHSELASPTGIEPVSSA
jgi:hypothetical protein